MRSCRLGFWWKRGWQHGPKKFRQSVSARVPRPSMQPDASCDARTSLAAAEVRSTR